MLPDSSLRTPWRCCLVLCASLWLAGCAPGATHEMLNAVLWQQQAAEYRAIALQTYALAELRLHEGLADPGWSAALEQGEDLAGLPPAVILDLDETVIDNARYEARIVTQLGKYDPESFADWCREGTPSAVPGAVAFIAAARRHDVKVFFYTARHADLRACTRRALDTIGVGEVAPEDLFLRDAGSKTRIRARLARDYRILLLVGDNLEDFVDGSKALPSERVAVARRHAEWFGRRWIVLPNPVYGHWEASHYGFAYDAPRGLQLERKRSALTR